MRFSKYCVGISNVNLTFTLPRMFFYKLHSKELWNSSPSRNMRNMRTRLHLLTHLLHKTRKSAEAACLSTTRPNLVRSNNCSLCHILEQVQLNAASADSRILWKCRKRRQYVAFHCQFEYTSWASRLEGLFCCSESLCPMVCWPNISATSSR